eukprot:1375311-Alexandrium_andersonii.AAC.1
MSASLVGSEMCIRDSLPTAPIEGIVLPDEQNTVTAVANPLGGDGRLRALLAARGGHGER